MSSRQRDEPSSLSGTSASRSSNSTSNAALTSVPPDATDTTLTTKVMTKTGTKTATPTGSDTGISSAVSAGIGAGTGIAVAGLILLFVAVVVFFHRRKRRDPDPAPPTPVAQTSSSAPLEQSSRVRPRPTGFAALIDCCRLEGKGEGEVEQQLVNLGIFIEQHAESSDYHRDTILVGADTLHESLRQLQLSEDTRHTVVRLSIDPSTREVGIRHLLALAIFQNIDTHSVGSLSLLPPALKELVKSLPKASNPEESQDPRVEPALMVWNRLTAFLMHHNPQTLKPLPPPPIVESQVKTLATLLWGFLMHFARTGDDVSSDVQQTRLENLITACVKFGYIIFSDPFDWKFIFSQEEREVLVVPGLEMLRNDMGELYDSPNVLLAPNVVTVDFMEDEGLFS